jgi:hypothetical protein
MEASMTALSDLSDVDLTGAQTGDRLALDGATWRPYGWRTVEADFAYPDGVSGGGDCTALVARTWTVDHIANVSSVPAAASLGTWTVPASADWDLPAAFDGFAQKGLFVGLSSGTVALTSARTFRFQVAVNGTLRDRSYASGSATTSTKRIAVGMLLPVESGDDIEFFGWMTTGTDSFPIDWLTAVPAPMGFGFSRSGRTVLARRNTTPIPSGLVSAPTGFETRTVGVNDSVVYTPWVGDTERTALTLGIAAADGEHALSHRLADAPAFVSTTDTALFAQPRRPSTGVKVSQLIAPAPPAL